MKTRILLTGMILMLSYSLRAQEMNGSGIPLIGSQAPSFIAETTQGKLSFPGDFGNNWKILFSHPQDFTPVCTSELIELTRMKKKFDELGIRVAIISTDTRERHLDWIKSIKEILVRGKQPSEIFFPLIDDSQMKVAKMYGMIHYPVSTTKDVRGVYIIGPSNTIESVFFYPSTVGRNMEEIVRTVEALQEVKSCNLYTPVNWKPGDDMLVPWFPYDSGKEADVSALEEDEYYFIGSMLWYKKMKKPEAK